MRDQHAIETSIRELVASGQARDRAVSIAYDRARRQLRHDAAADGGHAQMVVHQVALAQRHGIAKPRRAMPQQNYPRALEAAYAEKLVALVRRARAAYDPLLKEIPKILANVQAARGDEPSRRTSTRLDADILAHRSFAGFDVVIENPIGSTRSWVDPTGKTGRTRMAYDYGFIAGVEGADGDEVDVYLGPNEDSPWVYVVHQNAAPEFTSYDEDKVMLGFPTAAAAERAYLGQYDDPRFFGGMTVMSLADFRAALAVTDGDKITHRADAGELEFARKLINEAASKMRGDLTAGDIEKLASYFARETSQAQRRELARQLTAALGVEVLPDEKYIPEIIKYFTHENATLIGSIPEELHQQVANMTARAFTKRMHPDTYAKLLQDRFDVAESRARFIARDQLSKLWGQVNAVRQRGVGITEFVWDTRKDNLVRPSHRRLQGKVFSFDDPPSVGLPGEDFNCVPGGELVSLHAPALKAFRRAYRGDLTAIVSSSGKTVNCTPNHPVLTTRGWLAAHLVEVGDYLVHAPAERLDVLVNDPERGDATAEQMFGALAAMGVAHRVTGAGVRFHGDSIDQEVDVVEVDRSLLLERATVRAQPVSDHRLADAAASALTVRHQAPGLIALGSSSGGGVSGGDDVLSLRAGHSTPAHEHRIGSAADLDERRNQDSTDDLSLNASATSDRLFADPGLVHADDLGPRYFQILGVSRVVHVGVISFDGVVYNFETTTGWFGSDGLIVHNCRCAARPVLNGILDAASKIFRGHQSPA